MPRAVFCAGWLGTRATTLATRALPHNHAHIPPTPRTPRAYHARPAHTMHILAHTTHILAHDSHAPRTLLRTKNSCTGFFRHMYQYFKPDDGDPDPAKNAVLSANMGNNMSKILMYDPKGYAKYQPETPPNDVIQSKKEKPTVKKVLEKMAPEEILYRKMPDGQFVPIPPNPTSLHDEAYSVNQAPKLVPGVTAISSVKPSVTSSMISGVSVATRLQDVMPPEGWNGWPDGKFQCFVTNEEFIATEI
ncbi:hypothetical protein BJ912DRAFT_1057011 [Pholiota molesta]|nr:hypothetical protein BJ912DRAFT_1057011 [Pholiota molesta]